MALLADYFDVVDFLAWDLSVDHVVTTAQAKRWYGLRQRDLVMGGLHLEPRYLSLSNGARHFKRVTFVLSDERGRDRSTSALYHLAGTAEIRYILQAPPSSWASTAARLFATMTPDALWESAEAKVAIEFDTGSYSRQRILDKAKAFSAYDRQVWGAPTATRVSNLRKLVCQVDPDARVVLAAAALARLPKED